MRHNYLSNTDWEARHANRRGLSLLELLVVITILSLSAATVLPMFSDDRELRVRAASSILISDIELAQTMTISYPEFPVVIKFAPEMRTYWLAYADSPDVPIAHPNTSEPYSVEFGTGRAASADDVTITLDQIPDDVLAFESSGGLTDFSLTPLIQLELSGHAVTLSIAPMTGTVRENDGAIADLEEK